jgi:hypothetical protein
MDIHRVNAMKDRKDASIEELKEIEEIKKEIAAFRVCPHHEREQKISEFRMKKQI